MDLNINKDIRYANTLTGEFYRSETSFEESKEKIFARSWQFIGDATDVKVEKQLTPIHLMPGVLDEPIVLTYTSDNLRCLSNVCTHRGKVLVEQVKHKSRIACGYHGRCFGLDGSFKSMPEFQETCDFPSEKDNLAQIQMEEWLGCLFVSLDPKIEFSKLIAPVMERCDFLPLGKLKFKDSLSKTYMVKSNWALYVDNYLEGFHVPYIHPALGDALDFKNYRYELFDYCNLQVGVAKEGEPCFDLPEGHVDFGKRIYAYYFWLYPNLMINVYPWGISLNYIQPLDHQNTKVIFRTYQFEGTEFSFEDNNIDKTELEDEAVVESVQKGIQSRYYHSGRFSATMEKCVHHFHSLVSGFMK